MSKFVAMKLVTGEEVIGEVINWEENFVMIEEPYSINYMPTAEGKYGIKFIPFAPYSDEKLFTFGFRNVIFTTTPSEEVVKHYISAVSYYNDPIAPSEMQSRVVH